MAMYNTLYADETLYLEEPYMTEAQSADPFHISAGRIATFFIFGLVICSLSGIRDVSAPMFIAARGLLAFILLVSILAPSRFGVPLFFLVLLVSTDIIQSSSEQVVYGEYNIASVWRLFVGPIRPSWIVFGASLILLAKNWTFFVDRRVKLAIIWFVTVPIFTGILYGGFRTFARSVEVPADIRLGLLLITSILLFVSFIRRNPDKLSLLLAVFIGGLLAVHLRDVIIWFLGRGPLLGGVSRASVDSAKSTIVFVLLFGIYLIIKRGRIFLGTIITLASLLLVIVFATRMIWLTSAFCCMLLVYLLGAKRLLIAVPVVLILTFGTWKLIKSVQITSLDVVTRRAQSFSTEGGGNYLSRLAPLRYAEFINSSNTNFKRFAFLWGSGYGGYYTEEAAPFPHVLIDAHPEYAASTGQFFYCHNYVFHMLFKHGIIGFIIISLLWLGPAWVCYKYVFNRGDPSMFNGILACILAFVPNAMLNLYWTGKGLLINGFIIAVLIVVAELYSSPAEEMSELETEQAD